LPQIDHSGINKKSQLIASATKNLHKPRSRKRLRGKPMKKEEIPEGEAIKAAFAAC